MLLIFTLIAYAPVWGMSSLGQSADFIWDDPDYVVNNVLLRDADGLARIWTAPSQSPQYYPLVFTTFWLEFQAWQLNPMGYHLTNIQLHALAAWLLWLLLERLKVDGALIAGVLFALHPVMVESVAWITERKNVLSACFYFASALAFFTWWNEGSLDVKRRLRFAIFTLLLFACALLSKSVTASLPAALAVVLWWKHGRIPVRAWTLLAPMLAIGVSAGVFTAWLERGHVGAIGPEWNQTVIERFLIAGRAVAFYLGKLVLPIDLAFIYPRWTVSQAVAWQYVFPIALIGLIAALWLMRRRVGRGPLAALLIFCGTLFPALGFLNVFPHRYSFVADHFQYHATAAVFALTGAAVLYLPYSRLIFLLLALTLGTLTHHHARNFYDAKTLWTDTLRKNPASWMVNFNLAQALLAENRAAEVVARRRALPPPDTSAQKARAIQLIEHARDLAPHLPETHWNLGLARLDEKRYDDALACFQRAIDVDPSYVFAYNSMGYTLVELGRVEEAIPWYRQAVSRAHRGYDTPQVNLAKALRTAGHWPEALIEFDKAVELRPNSADLALLAGDVAQKAGDSAKAQKYFELARRLPAGS